MRYARLLFAAIVFVSVSLSKPLLAELSDAQLINVFDVPDNGEVHEQDDLTWDGNNLWAVSHTDDQHHYLSRLTIDGALIEQFPTNAVYYSGTVTGLAYRFGVGLLVKIRKRIYTVDNNVARVNLELSSSTKHKSIAFNELSNTVICTMPYNNGVRLIYKDADMQPHPEWGNNWYYVNTSVVVPTGQVASALGGVTYANGHLYIAHKNIYKVDITNQNHPVIVDVLTMPEDVSPVGLTAVDNTLLYVGIRDIGSGNLNQIYVYDLATNDDECGDFFTRRDEYRDLVHAANNSYNGREFVSELRIILTKWWMLRRACHTTWFIVPHVEYAKLAALAEEDGLFGGDEDIQNVSWGNAKAFMK